MKKRLNTHSDDTKVDMTPMLDIIFIMLIFFIVATAFVRESGMNLDSQSGSSTPGNGTPLLISISANNEIQIGERVTDIARVGAYYQSLAANNADLRPVVVASYAARTDTMVRVIDALRSAGLDNVPVRLARD